MIARKVLLQNSTKAVTTDLSNDLRKLILNATKETELTCGR